jgi:hypothetical protein
MTAPTRTPRPDARTPSQIAADEAAASGNWEGFETETLLTEEEARRMLEQRRSTQAGETMTQTVAMATVRNQPFRWRDKVFRVLRCDYVNGQAQVEVVPPDPEFVAELKRRVEQDRFHSLTYYQGFGFIAFPEDYAKYAS